MNKVLNTLKALVLFGALAIVGWSAIPSSAVATEEEGAFCERNGHSCHVLINGVLYHLEEQPGGSQ